MVTMPLPVGPSIVASPYTNSTLPQFLYLPKIVGDGIPCPPTGPTGDEAADRNFVMAQAVSQRTTGQTLDAWAVNQMAQAAYNGLDVFNMVSLNPVRLDVERGLIEMLRYHAIAFNVHARLRIVLSDQHEPSEAMRRGIEELTGQSDHNISVDVKFCDYRRGLPVDRVRGADLIFALSHTPGESSIPKASVIHDCLRPPVEDLPGGEALMLLDASLSRLLRRYFASLCTFYGVDMVAVQPGDPYKPGVAHIKRRRNRPIGEYLPLMIGNAASRRWPSIFRVFDTRFSLVAPSAGISGISATPFSQFLAGADRLFHLNRLPTGALTMEGHRSAFTELLPDILGGMPAFTAATVAYGNPSVIASILAHGDSYPAHVRSMVFPKSLEQMV